MWANLSQMHRATAERLGLKPAIRYKRHGVYHDVSWESYRRQTDRVANGLCELGIQAGDRVGLLSENRPEWLIADIAILATGAIDVPLHAPLTAQQIRFQLHHSGARGVLVSNQTQADKLASILGNLPQIEFVVPFDPIATDVPIRIVPWSELTFGQPRRDQPDAQVLAERESKTHLDDVATIIYTSGTTGNPKGVMLTHGNLITNAVGMREQSILNADDILLSWLPYSHVYARTVDHYLNIDCGATICLAEGVEALVTNLEETSPTWMTAVPRFYEKVWTSVEQLAAQDRRDALRRIFGTRIRWLSSGGAPLPRRICEGFLDAGLLLMEGYGLTESSPVISFNRVDCYKVGTVGLPIPGVEVKIADDGEILTRGPHVMKGYWNDPIATDAAIQDGWLYTGDVGSLDADGFLSITDRKKDLLITSTGKNVAPAELERLLAADEYIDQAVVYGDGRHFLSALVVPNFARLESAARMLDCRLTTDGEFFSCPELLAFYAERIARAMAVVSPAERVRKFLLLARPLTIECDELTATLKVRRRAITGKFEQRLDALYD